MSCHLAILAAATSKDALLAAMESAGTRTVALRTPDFGPGADEVTNFMLDLGGEGLLLLESGGRAYAVDFELVLIDPGFIKAVSEHAACLVAAGFAEGASITGALVVADRGRILRSAWLEPESDTFSENIGEPFPTEAATPIDGNDGEGQWEAMRSLGFDPWAWYTARPIEVRMHRGNLEAHLKSKKRPRYAPFLSDDVLASFPALASPPVQTRKSLFSRLLGR